jgi:alanyl-tRNA synthetase
VRFRVVADHVRSSLMLIGDGVTPATRAAATCCAAAAPRVRSMRLLGVEDRRCRRCCLSARTR